MTKKSTRGFLTAERGVPSEMITVSEKSGWVVDKVSINLPPNTSDSYIAGKYGKGKSILLTEDKTAYKQNVEGGFVGYIAYGQKPRKEVFDKFMLKFKELMSTKKRKDLEGYNLIINCETGEYVAKPIKK